MKKMNRSMVGLLGVLFLLNLVLCQLCHAVLCRGEAFPK